MSELKPIIKKDV